jgi:phospholipid/cholesterol/gamma-HCH transport system ATP-binding protein
MWPAPTPVAVESIQRLKFENLSFSYEEGVPIFQDLTLDIPTNRTIYMTGNLGGGQSTFLKLLAVLVNPQQGAVFINDHDTTEMSFEEFMPLRMKIGYSFDYGGLFANRTLHENLVLPLLYHKVMPKEEADAMVKAMAKEYGFERQAHQRPALVSGGLRKLICVLRAFVMRPQMVVLDDPFTGVGSDASRKIVRLLQERRESGELKHIYFTSREEVYAHWVGCDSMFFDGGKIHYEERMQTA